MDVIDYYQHLDLYSIARKIEKEVVLDNLFWCSIYKYESSSFAILTMYIREY